MVAIDPDARIANGANIGSNASIGPFCYIGPNVTIGEGCRLISHVHITGMTTIGYRTIIYPFASLGAPPQVTRYRGGPTRLVIGAECEIRESVTMNTGTEDGGGLTSIGARGLFMANSHVAHDCHVGNDVTFANGATLGGHCTIGDHVVIGGLSAVHQFARVGAGAMIGGLSGLRGDLIPFGLASGCIASLCGLNVVGLRRQNFSREQIHVIRRAYRELFLGSGNFSRRLDLVEAAFGTVPAVKQIMDFIRAGKHRPICHPAASQP
jgi:UDP-N-acetylglucosamine acyltransferase